MTRAPVIAACGAGVDSTAMIIELVEAGAPIDMVLFADTGSEKADTYGFIPIFRRWMDAHDVPSEIVRYEPRNFKHWPPYDSLATNMLTNGTLPSKAFGRGILLAQMEGLAAGSLDGTMAAGDPVLGRRRTGRQANRL